jgi:hypothetical protein
MAPAALLAIALAASEQTAEAEETVERRAGILTGVGCAFAVGGGVALGVGIQTHTDLFDVAGSLLLAVAVHAVSIAVFSWLWPDDSWLHIFSRPTPAERGASGSAALQSLSCALPIGACGTN